MSDKPDRLQALPPELLNGIAELIPRPSDLKALCLTSKPLRIAALPHLYETVNFNAGTIVQPLMSGFLSAKNAGLTHIRTLILSAQDLESGDQQCRLIKSLLQLVPRNSLKNLLPYNVSIDEETFSKIFTQQQSLKTLSLGPLTFDPLPLLQSNFFGKTAWAQLEFLMIPGRIGSIQDLKAYSHILRSASGLRAVCIETVDSNEQSLKGRLQDSENEDGVLLATLFSHCPKDAVPAKLVQLTLRDISVVAAQRNIMTRMDFSCLQILKVWRCSGWQNLLRATTELFKSQSSMLRRFDLEVTELDGQTVFDFLCSFGGLQELYLSGSKVFKDFDTSCLESHRSTLEILAIAMPHHCRCTQASQPFLGGMLRFCRFMPQLRQLGITMPPVRTISMDTEEFQRYDENLDGLLSLPHLEVLRIFNWPQASSGIFAAGRHQDGKLDRDGMEGCQVNYHMEVMHLVKLLIERHRQRYGDHRLPIICFGGQSWSLGCDGQKHEKRRTICYRAIKQGDGYGGFRDDIEMLPNNQVRYEVADDHILHFRQ